MADSDYDALLDLAGRFGNLTVDGLGEAMSLEIDRLIRQSFDEKVGPEGEVWPHNKTTPWYFDPDNHLRDSVAVGYGHHEIIVNSTHHAFAFQIYGTYGGTRIQEHPLMPEDVRHSMWGSALDQAYWSYCDETLGADTGRSLNRVGKPRRGTRR